MNSVYEYIKSLNESNKFNYSKNSDWSRNKLKYFRIGFDNKNYFVLDEKGKRYTNIQTLRDVVLLLQNHPAYISNISELLKSNIINKYYMLKKDWQSIYSILMQYSNFNNVDTFIIERITNKDIWLGKAALRKNFELLLVTCYFILVRIENKIYLVSDILFVVDNSSQFRLGYNNLKYIFISNVDTTKMNSFRDFCYNNENLISFSFDCDSSNIIDFSSMFYNCVQLQSLKIPDNFIMKKARYLQCMFKNCESLKSIDIHNSDISNVVDYHEMFYNCINLRSLNIGVNTINKIDIKSFTLMFGNCLMLDKNCIKKIIDFCGISVLY